MKHLFLLISFTFYFYTNAQEFNISEQQIKLIDSLVKEYPNGTNIAIAIINDENVAYYGIAKNENVYYEIDNHLSVFEIGSITKTFTANVMVQLYLEKLIDINKPIRKYLKVKLKDKPNFTFINLSNHTSGLPRLPSNLVDDLSKYPQNPYAKYTNEDLEYYLKNELSLIEKIGAKSLYSNLGVGLLAYTLCEVTHKSLEELYTQRIFTPLNMMNSSSIREKINMPIVKGLGKDGNEVLGWDFEALAGAGAILSNVEDMAKYAQNIMIDNEINTVLSTETISINDNFGVALGWHLLKENGNSLLWHNGATGGYNSSMCVDRENKKSVIILSNLTNEITNGGLDELSIELLKTL